MKTNLILWSLVLFQLPCYATALGPSSSGGGMAVVCRDANGGVSSAELLDVYEAKNTSGLSVMQPSGALLEDSYRLAKNTYHLQGYPMVLTRKEVERNLQNFFAIVRWLPEAESLPFLADHGKTIALPLGCNLEQLAIFYDSSYQVEIDKEIWLSLDSLNQAALVSHEMFYQWERKFREMTSESTRSYIRQIVSTAGFTPVKAGADQAELSCSAHSGPLHSPVISSFYLHKKDNGSGGQELMLQFDQLAGRPILVKTTAEFSGVDFNTTKVFENGHYRLYPKPGLADTRVKMQVQTEHRSDWEILFKYVSGEPVTIALIQDGILLDTAELTNCVPN